MVGALVANRAAELVLLLVRHMAGDTLTPRGCRGVLGVGGHVAGLATVAAGALAVVEATRNGLSVSRPIPLAVGIMTGRAGHAAVAIAVAGVVPFLIREGAGAPIGGERFVAQLRQVRGVVGLERSPGHVPRGEARLEGVTAHTGGERPVLIERAERRQSNVCAHASGAHSPHMRGGGAVARLAVDGQRSDVGTPAACRAVERDRDTTAMARLAVAEARVVAEDARRGPVAAIGQPHFAGDGLPPSLGSRAGVAKPDTVAAAPIEREEPLRAVGPCGHESLRAAAVHMAAPDHPVHREGRVGFSLALHEEAEPAVRLPGNDHGVAKADGHAVKWRDDAHVVGGTAGHTTGRAVRGALPCCVLGRMARLAALGPGEVSGGGGRGGYGERDRGERTRTRVVRGALGRLTRAAGEHGE